MVEITDQESAEAFFNSIAEDKRQDVASALSCRAAARVMPFLIRADDTDWESLILTAMRAVLTSGSRANCDDPDVRAALRSSAASSAASTVFFSAASAASSAFSAASSARSASSAHSAASSAHSAASAAASSARSARSARFQPLSGALAVYSVAYSALSADSALKNTIGENFLNPVWPDGILDQHRGLRGEIDKSLKIFLKFLSHPDWNFFHRWFTGIWNGTPLDWDLATQVALIPNADWEKGITHLAGVIRGVEDNLGPKWPDHVPKLETQKLRRHVEHLLQAPVASADIAWAQAQQFDAMIADYKRETPANQLPEGMEPFEHIPEHFRKIAKVFQSSAEKNQKIDALETEIHALNNRVAELETSLEQALSQTLTGRFSCAAIDSFGKSMGNGMLPGAIIIGTAHFFGIAPLDITFSNLRDYIEGVMAADPMPDPPSFKGNRSA